MMKLENKLAIVTGGGGGIGRGIVRCLAEEGAHVVIADVDVKRATEVAEEVMVLGRRPLVVEADVTKMPHAQHVVDQALAVLGKIDILVNNVGGGLTGERPMGFLAELDEIDWDTTYEVDMKSQFFMCKAVVPHMISCRYGKIVNMSSIGAKYGMEMMAPYCAMKGAVIAFTMTLARELARYSINVNCICAGLIYTPLWETVATKIYKRLPRFANMEPREVFDWFVRTSVPLKREQTPEDIGHAVVFLASEDSNNITGESLDVGGGILMG